MKNIVMTNTSATKTTESTKKNIKKLAQYFEKRKKG